MSKSYVAILAVVLVAALLGMAIAEDQGYLLIAWRNVSIETSIWVGIGFLLACWLLLWLARSLWRLLTASGRRINPWSRRNLQQRAGALATRGLLEFAEGHWKQAVRLLKPKWDVDFVMRLVTEYKARATRDAQGRFQQEINKRYLLKLEIHYGRRLLVLKKL